ncbi:hypothetical protein BRD03_04435 [Halobacteriales archaeon QS_9_68_17]|nr:MAG: hypothetical protein BRD03_04435 [Halobacteriales archaeon QS_9_68_17]
MTDDSGDRDSAEREGPIAVVPATGDGSPAYWLRSDDGETFPVREDDIGDAYAVLSRQADADTMPDPVEVTCHERGRTWRHRVGGQSDLSELRGDDAPRRDRAVAALAPSRQVDTIGRRTPQPCRTEMDRRRPPRR